MIERKDIKIGNLYRVQSNCWKDGRSVKVNCILRVEDILDTCVFGVVVSSSDEESFYRSGRPEFWSICNLMPYTIVLK